MLTIAVLIMFGSFLMSPLQLVGSVHSACLLTAQGDPCFSFNLLNVTSYILAVLCFKGNTKT